MKNQWLIIADDLTGAADCGIAFSKVGLSTVVVWDSEAKGDHAVWSIAANSRALPSQKAAEKQMALLKAYHQPHTLVYKKIDSTMRGQPIAELLMELEYLEKSRNKHQIALLAPAFPATGRTTESGHIRVSGVPLEHTPLWARDHTYETGHLPTILESFGLKTLSLSLSQIREGVETIKTCLTEALERKVAAVVCDAVSEDDLAIIATASLPLAENLLWVGSGGLSGHLAKQCFDSEVVSSPRTQVAINKPILFAVGSLAEASQKQVDYLTQEEKIKRITISIEALVEKNWALLQTELKQELEKNHDVIVKIGSSSHPNLSKGPDFAASLSEFVETSISQVGALVMTGGETGCALLSRLGVTGIKLIDEIEPGVPLGITIGKTIIPVVSKAGAFGDEKTMKRCLTHLKKGKNP